MMKQANSQIQGGAPKRRAAAKFFHRLKDNTRLLFRGKNGLRLKPRAKFGMPTV